MRTDEAEEADPNDPYITKEDILQVSPNAFPDTYEPMLEYPGTMRPGRTPENMPYHDLPGLGMNDPEPVPWPHFQEIEWHHLWDPPHEQALAMEEFIEVEGRWASVEEEAEMRMGMRRGVRERREMEEMSKAGGGGEQMVIMDDDEDDESMIGLGEGVEALLKSPASVAKKADADEEEEEDDEDDDDDDFMLDLGLGDDDDDDDQPPSKKKATKMKAGDDEEEDDDLDLDGMLGFDDDDDDDDFEEEDTFDDDDDDMNLDDYNSKDDGGDDVDNYDDVDDY